MYPPLTVIHLFQRFGSLLKPSSYHCYGTLRLHGRPFCWRSSVDHLPFLNVATQLYTVLLPGAWSPQTTCKRRWMLAVEAPSFHRNHTAQVSASISSVVV